jgi:murein DD-endopeptidase MepM/ murein hydrolase activator NlpD
MPIRLPATLLGLALLGCATTQQASLATSDAAKLRDVPPPRVSAVPPPPEVDPLPVETVSGDVLRQRLLLFASEAQAARAAALPGDAMSSAQLARWEWAQTQVECFLKAETSADDVSAVRALLQAVLDLDARTYQPLSAPLVEGLDMRFADLDARFSEASPEGLHRGGYRWPLSTVRVTSPFGRRFHPIQRRWKLHSGVDLAADANEPVLAAATGMVVRAGWTPGYGYEVELQHAGGLMTRYSHLASPLVLEGTAVQAGDPLGLAGKTGTATGVHLHFEFVRGGVPRDPLKEFAKLVGAASPKVVVLTPRSRGKKKETHAEEPGA